jgi:hypothetical protein
MTNPTNTTKENDTLRERLLSHLPQPANVSAYREGIDQLLKKQEASLRTFTWTHYVLSACVLFLGYMALYLSKHHAEAVPDFLVGAGVFFLLVLTEKPMLDARRLHIELLKEIKQVQVQLLELQLQINNKTHASSHPESSGPGLSASEKEDGP